MVVFQSGSVKNALHKFNSMPLNASTAFKRKQIPVIILHLFLNIERRLKSLRRLVVADLSFYPQRNAFVTKFLQKERNQRG